MPSDNTLLKKYEDIEQNRRDLNNAIDSQDRLFLPLAIGVFAFLGTQLPEAMKLGIVGPFYWLGGFLLTILLVSWRWISHYNDWHIVKLYRDEVELEKQLGFNVRSKYIYQNLSGHSKKALADKVGIEPKKLKRLRYEPFVIEVSKTDSTKHYDYLIEVLEEGGYWSPSTRGHIIWNVTAILLIALWWSMGLIFRFGADT